MDRTQLMTAGALVEYDDQWLMLRGSARMGGRLYLCPPDGDAGWQYLQDTDGTVYVERESGDYEMPRKCKFVLPGKPSFHEAWTALFMRGDVGGDPAALIGTSERLKAGSFFYCKIGSRIDCKYRISREAVYSDNYESVMSDLKKYAALLDWLRAIPAPEDEK